MTDQTAQEPTMEEILASIRRIISEDEAPADVAPAAAAAEADEPADDVPEADGEAETYEPSPALMDETPAMQEDSAPDEDVLELTDRYEEPAEAEPAPAASDTIGDLDIGEPQPFPADPEPSPARSEPVSAKPDYDALVGESAAASAASAFAGLAASMRTPEPTASTAAGPTIDELARTLLRPMLKEWLDANLPGIVEAEVRKEVERIARNGGR